MARLIHQSSMDFPGHNDLSIPPSQPRTPIVEDKQLAFEDVPSLPTANDQRRSSYEFHQVALHNSDHSGADPEKRGPVPEEYRLSRTEGGVLPKRVLHSRGPSDVEFNLDGAHDTTSAANTDVEKEAGSETSSVPSRSPAREKQDPNIIDWDGPDDPADPMNWKTSQKTATISLASVITFITPLASSIFAPGVPELMSDFHSTNELLASFVVSIYLLGFAFGPLIIAPASEIVGRVPVYHAGNILFMIFSIACAVSTDIPMFCVFRFFQGAAGATPLTNGGASIADVIPTEKRGAAMAVWALGPLVGPVAGPVIGGFLSQAKGWRWVFWLLTIVSGALTILSFLFLRETYAPVILGRKAARLRKETGNPNLRSKLDTGLTPRDFFKRAIVRPTKLLLRSPIVFLLSLNVSVIFAYLYLLFTTFTYVYEEQYHFTTGTSGLSYLGIGVGAFIGLGLVGKSSDAILKKRAAIEGSMKPEHRLPPLIFGPILVAVGLFGYGWSAQEKVHWIVPIILTGFFGIGLIVNFMPTQTYLVDAFGRYAASAVAALTLLRSLFGAILPLAGQPMYDALGLGWGNSLLGFICLLMIPIPFLFMKYGERVRTSKRFALDL